jgi:Zn-dependent protease with chaperone function
MRRVRATTISLQMGLVLAMLIPWLTGSLAATVAPNFSVGESNVVAASPFSPSDIPAGQEAVSQAEALIRQAREQGVAYLNSKDDRAKKSAKKNLEDAEKILKDALKRDPNCEKCVEGLVATHFYQTYFGFAKNYDECTKLAKQGLERFPTNTRIAFFKGYAHYNSGEYSEATKAFNRYLAGAAGDSQSEAQVRKLLQDSQQRFMTSWYHQANFYNSKESRIDTIGQDFRTVTLFQVTPEWELNLGGQAFAQITSQSPPMQDRELQQYLENIVTRLTSKTPGSSYNYTVTVLNSPTVNALTVPGHVFVATGLVAFADNESELAGVLAHEMAHNYGHHAARRFIKAYEVQMVASAIAQAVNPKSQVAQLATQLVANIGMGLFLNAYSRFEEKEADLYGTHIMFNAGYDPTAMSSFFTKMYKANPKQPIKFLSTHPPVPDRATYLIDYLDSFPLQSTEVRTDSQEFQRIRSRIAATMPGSQQEGSGRGVLPPQF